MRRQAGLHEGVGAEADGRAAWVATALAIAGDEGAGRLATAGDEGAGRLAAGLAQAVVSSAISVATRQRDLR